MRVVLGTFVVSCVALFAPLARAACPDASLDDGGRRAVLALDEHEALRATYDAEREATFRAVRRSSSTAEDADGDATGAGRHIGATYLVSGSARDLCRGADAVTMGTTVHGGLLAVEEERWAGSVLVADRRVFQQVDDERGARTLLGYGGLLLSGAMRYRQAVEVEAGVLAAERVDGAEGARAPKGSPARAFLVAGVPGTRLRHATVVSGGGRPLTTTYLALDDLRTWRAPVAVSAKLGYLDPTRQGFAGAGVALTLPALRLGVDASAETSATGPRLRHGGGSLLLGGTHVFRGGGAYVSGGLRLSASQYVGSTILPRARTAPGFGVGMFAGGGLPWVAMGVDAKVAQNDPDELAVLPATLGNGSGSIRALVRVTPHVRKLPPSFRGPLDVVSGLGDGRR